MKILKQTNDTIEAIIVVGPRGYYDGSELQMPLEDRYEFTNTKPDASQAEDSYVILLK